MAIRPTASRLDLATHCVGAWSLGLPWPPREETPAMRRGIAVHGLIEAHLRGTAYVPPEDVADEALAAYGAWCDWWERLRAVHAVEIVAVECPISAALHGGEPRVHEAYQDMFGDTARVGGIADAVLWVDGRLVICDWKTGAASGLDPDSLQPRVLAWIARALWAPGADSVVAGLVSVTPSGVEELLLELRDSDLAVAMASVAAIWRRIERGAPPVPGDWCTYCPLTPAYCPAVAGESEALAVQRGEAPSGPWPYSLEIQSPEHAAWMLPRVQAVAEACEQLMAALRAWADEHGGIRMPDGRIWRAREYATEQIVAEKATEVLRTAAPEALVAPTSKAALERAVGKERARQLLDELRRQGAIESVQRKSYSYIKGGER